MKDGEKEYDMSNEKFRAHHILCTLLYEGKGYSGAFCENMNAVTGRLEENQNERFTLVAQPDIICGNCPNLTATGECESSGERVVSKDRRIMELLALTEQETYTYPELCRRTKEHMTEESFLQICGTCDWRKQGLCRYEDLVAKLARF